MSPTVGDVAGTTSSADQPARYLGERRFCTVAQAAEWDSRYSERDGAIWSGRPNGRLVAEVADLAPGRALDVGCGEGADAIWLAQRGWAVTAVDISDIAIGGRREAAELAGAEVDWVVGDALRAPFPARSFDLVSLQYPALPKAAGGAAVRTLLGTVRPGGLLLAVYHDLDDDHREHMKSRGVDPADYVGADDLGLLLGDGFTVELHSVEPRLDAPPGTRAYRRRRPSRPPPLTALTPWLFGVAVEIAPCWSRAGELKPSGCPRRCHCDGTPRQSPDGPPLAAGAQGCAA